MRPTYGTNISAAMFENQGNVEKAINQAVRSAIGIWRPELTVEQVNVTGFLEDGKVSVEVNVTLPDFTTSQIRVLSTTLNPDATTTR
jgi:phage baseplate assembly protein W